MRNVVLASLLGVSAGAYVLPAVGAGPVHFRVTQPHSVTALVPDVPAAGTPVTVTFPTTPLELIVTDITFSVPRSSYWDPVSVELRANGTTVLVGRAFDANHISLNTGVAIPAGATLTATVQGVFNTTGISQTVWERGITLSGYIQ